LNCTMLVLLPVCLRVTGSGSFTRRGEGLIEGGSEDTVVSTMVPKVPSLSDVMVSRSDRFPETVKVQSAARTTLCCTVIAIDGTLP